MQFPVSKSIHISAVKPLLLVSVLASCFATAAIAQDAGNIEEKTLEPVVVTASRVEQLQKDAIPNTTVITSQMIENKKLDDVLSLLRSEAGIEFSRSGGAGTTTSVFMRGTESRHVLVLLDGVPVQDAMTPGTVDILSHIQLDQIDHIEVVRGNVSAIYGSGAMGGVIQIFTKQGSGKPSANVFAEYGRYNTVKLGTGVSGQHENTRFALSLTRYKTNGFSSMDPGKNSMVNPDDDPDRNVSLNATLSQRLNKDHEIGARLFMYNARFDYDGGNGSQEDAFGKSRQKTAALFSKNRWTKDWLSTVTVSYTDIDRRSEVANASSSWGNYKSRYQSNATRLQWENQFALAENWTLTAGVDAANEKGKFGDGYSRETYTQDKYSAYAGILGKVGAHNLQANVRYDHVEDAGADTTGYLGYGYDLTSNWKLLASASTSFLAPTLNQRYIPIYGNKDLQSEHSTNYEGGIQYSKNRDLVKLTVFQWHTRDLIGYDALYRNINIGKAKNTGVELNAATYLLGLDVRANLTWQDPKNKDTDSQLLKRAKFFGSVNVSKTMGAWYLGGDIQYNGSRQDYKSVIDTYHLESYWLVNLNARYNINKNVSLYARIENLLNKDYETVYGYEQPGRGAYVGVNVKM